MTYSYLYVYRTPRGNLRDVNWDEPTGGLVMEHCDYQHANCVAAQRYHCGPGEQLILMDVGGDKEQEYQATILHLAWDLDMREFQIWMNKEQQDVGTDKEAGPENHHRNR